MKFKRSWLAVPAVLALSLTACSSGGGDEQSASGDASASGSTAASTGIVTGNSSEPQNPLIPTNTNEVGGGKILDLIFAGLVYYDADGAAHNEMAESIDTDDNITWTITLKQGQKFSDGTEVKAHNFVDAWKAGAKNADLSAYFFSPIEGADDEGSGDLTGLNVVDDYTFTVKLKQAESDFGSRLGYSAFYPLPDSTLADPETGGENPVGNGPYMVADGGWQHNVQIDLIPNPEYTGDRTAQNGGVTLVFYTTQDAAYNDLLSDNLDVLDAVPDSAFGTFETDLDGRSVNQPAAIFQSFTIPTTLEHFGMDDEGRLRREAISYAIDRDQITETIFQGTRTPAKDFTSPVVDGYNDAIPGSEVLTYDPDKAKELWAQADAISPYDGTFTIGYNSDGGHQAWVDAVANSISNTLGITAQGNPYPDFKSLRTDVTGRTITGAFRTGWQADYPGKYNFLAPLYGTGAGSNDGDYSNADFDSLLSQAAAAPSADEASSLLDQAQEILFKDLPAIPLWYSNVTGGYSTLVDNVEFGWNSVPLYYEITKAE
ncbi:MAG: ABC transporter substrate-binding protein [Actinomyces sp.]|jgi:oligopeptide transport system substrate-binding protein|nr:ABC transporter substrate-binding protein [Actinomyces sp.]MCI1642590.1 ABC transporter substrate-binding protein [Actinomyces sp.]MCI1663097.1 ABC transporter substrate-binding protein [Actinomyces sp.]MCI1692162.1 ABC transporter substrate-binding protein [Actinomyces sp.]MCI1788571.1 ABC transporter substrate-binding protein [Actinomyces sp.]